MEDFKQREKEVFDFLNSVRADPKSIIHDLEEMRGYFKNNEYSNPKLDFNVMTEEGVAAVDDAIQFLQKQPQLPKLVRSEELSAAAAKLVAAIGPSGKASGDSENLSMEVRVKEAKNDTGSMAENISFGWNDPKQIVYQMIIDDGVKTRGHRANFFSTMFTEVGIAMGQHKTYNYCCVFDLFGKSSIQDKALEQYEIPKEKWPKDAVSLTKHLEMKIKDGKKLIKLTYEFKLTSGEVTKLTQDFEEPHAE